jgi:DNA-binding response OmpR family regulator
MNGPALDCLGANMRILLVEDDPRIAEVILEGLTKDGLVVAHAPNATEGLNLAQSEHFDLWLFDVMLPEGREAGFGLARRLRDLRQDTPLLLLTARADMDSKLEGLDAGADDYLAKPFDFRELRARIRALVRRAKGGSSNTVHLPLGYTLDLAACEVRQGEQVVPLTPREYALLECFAINPGRTYSRPALIARVWPGDTEVDLKTVDVFVSTVRRKLKDGVIETVRGIGYRLGRLELSGGAP